MRVLGLDFETTGLDSESDRVIEIGAVLWDTDKNKPLQIYSELVLPEPFNGIPQEVQKLTGIHDDEVYEFGVDGDLAFKKLLEMIQAAEALVAHNAPFDRGFLEKELERLELPIPDDKLWIDTILDVPYPESISTRKLSYLAAEHGFLNPYAHRALFDVLTMFSVMKNYPIDEIKERAKSPSVEVISHVSYGDRQKAKDMGFRWSPERKQWFKPMKECDVSGLSFPFEVSVQPL